MLTPIEEIFARLSTLEFALEVVMANHLCNTPADSSSAFKSDFVRLMRSPNLASPDLSAPFTSDHEQKEAEIVNRAGEMAERLMQKVSEREVLIRTQKTQLSEKV